MRLNSKRFFVYLFLASFGLYVASSCSMQTSCGTTKKMAKKKRKHFSY